MRLLIQALGRTVDLRAGKDQPEVEAVEREPDRNGCTAQVELAGQWDHDKRTPVGFSGSAPRPVRLPADVVWVP